MTGLALAGVTPMAIAAEPSPAQLALTFGIFTREHPGQGPVGGGIEYRLAPSAHWRLQPSIGLTLAESGAAYAYVGVHRDFDLGRNWTVTPALAGGVFHHGGQLELGSALEFKTGLEVTRAMPNSWRFGLGFYHLSNGGVSGDNPGTEAFEIVVRAPLGSR